MSNNVLVEAYHKILQDTKLIRIAVITSFFHSLIFILYVLYQTYVLIQLSNDNSFNIAQLREYIEILFGTRIILILFIIVAIIAAVGFFLLPPIAKSSIIYYIHANKSASASLGKGIKKFFPMFEFHALVSVFSLIVFIIAFSRFYALGVIGHPLVVFIMVVWFTISILNSLFLPYTNFLITLKDYTPSQAIKKSISLTLENFGTTFKFVLIGYLFFIRFLINILIVLGIPIGIMLLFIKLNISQSEYTKYLIYTILALLMILAAYINAIVEAFFITYWHKVYLNLEE